MDKDSFSLKQIGQGFMALLLLILFVWLAFYALIVVLVLAAAATVYVVVRRFLAARGIVSEPKAGPDIGPGAQIIETEYQDVTNDKPAEKNDDAN